MWKKEAENPGFRAIFDCANDLGHASRGYPRLMAPVDMGDEKLNRKKAIR
ncbi:MAG: hypothetical protein WCT08_00425 [Patescibacteria group bacterium]|jgi:hypothetical protein